MFLKMIFVTMKADLFEILLMLPRHSNALFYFTNKLTNVNMLVRKLPVLLMLKDGTDLTLVLIVDLVVFCLFMFVLLARYNMLVFAVIENLIRVF